MFTFYVHWPTPSDNGILLTRCTDKHSSAGSACLISFPSICNLLPGWDRTSHKVKICEFQKWALTVLFFSLCIYTNAQSYVVSWWQWHCCLQKDLASSTFHTSTHITAQLSLLAYLKNGMTTPTSTDFYVSSAVPKSLFCIQNYPVAADMPFPQLPRGQKAIKSNCLTGLYT